MDRYTETARKIIGIIDYNRDEGSYTDPSKVAAILREEFPEPAQDAMGVARQIAPIFCYPVDYPGIDEAAALIEAYARKRVGGAADRAGTWLNTQFGGGGFEDNPAIQRLRSRQHIFLRAAIIGKEEV